jgi:hypothetical protein
VAQWAASDRLLPTSNLAGTIRFGTREPAFQPGQPIEIVVRSSEAITPLPKNAIRGVRILRNTPEGDALVTTVPLLPAEGRPSEIRATVGDLPPGRYWMELEIPAWADHLLDAQGKRLRGMFEVLPFDGEEMLELAANRPLMRELADSTQGKVFEPGDWKTLADELLSKSSEIEQRSARPLRTSWWAFAAILALLVCEWGLRKWAGLP